MVAPQQFDPLEFLQVADSLSDRGSSEANLRTAVNRIYYATFLATREALQTQDRRRIHGRVIGELKRHDRHASRHLDMLMDLRVAADYQLEVQESDRNDWRENYGLARRLSTFVLERLP